jgi:hypothetical protein
MLSTVRSFQPDRSEGDRAPEMVQPGVREGKRLPPVRQIGQAFRLNVRRKAVSGQDPIYLAKVLSEPFDAFGVGIGTTGQYPK